MDYEKMYKEALERADSLTEKYGGRTFAEYIFPELTESEDERMINKLISHFKWDGDTRFTKEECDDAIAWLEKQKEQKPVEVDESTKRLNDNWMKQHFDDYREQKPISFNVPYYPDDYEVVINGNATGLKLKEQKPAEWSEEDEQIIKTIVSILERSGQVTTYEQRGGSLSASVGYSDKYKKEIDWLKSLRPQLREEIYQTARHDLAIRFMNYLDENRPEGKMSLSNEECEDIDKAFKENDWAKIIRYVEKYSPSWKPSEGQLKALKKVAYNLVGTGTETDVYLVQLYEQLKKL